MPCIINTSLTWVLNFPLTAKSYLLLERYWPIFSWLFHRRRCKARTLPSLMKERLWFTASLVGQSDAISRKNLKKQKANRKFYIRYTSNYKWIKFIWSQQCEVIEVTQMEGSFTHCDYQQMQKKDQDKVGISFLVPDFTFREGS